MKPTLAIVTWLTVWLWPQVVHAQMFAGYDAFCGVPVIIMPTAQNAVAARDAFGRPVIYIDPGVMNNWTMSRKFVLAHECAHHMLGHSLPAGLWFRNTRYWATRAQELEADCWAARKLAETEDTEDLRRTILQFASMGAAPQGAYPAGFERAQAAAHCAGVQLAPGRSTPESRRVRWQYEYSRLDSDVWRKSIKFSSEEACINSQRRRNSSDNYVALDCEEIED